MSHSSCLTDPVGSLWEHSGGKQVQLEEKVWTRNQLVSDGWTRHIVPVDREGREPQNWMLRLIVLVPAIASTWHDSFESQFLVENLLGRLIQFSICRFNFWWLPFGFLFHLRIWKKDQRRTMIYDILLNELRDSPVFGFFICKEFCAVHVAGKMGHNRSRVPINTKIVFRNERREI